MKHSLRRSVPRPGVVLLLVAVAAWSWPTRAGAQRIERSAVAGGAVGALLIGSFGALVGRGICDAADCSSAWVDGAVPGLVLGGLIGAAAAAGVAALTGENQRAATDSAPRTAAFGRLTVMQSSLKAGFGSGAGNGIGATVGVRRRGLSAGVVVERLAGTDLSVSSVRGVGRLEAMHSTLRPAAMVSVGQFGWSFPGPGGVREQDSYLGLDLGVGLGASLTPQFRLTLDVRFHNGGGPSNAAAAGRRQMRLISLGLDFTFRNRGGHSQPPSAGHQVAMGVR